MTARDLYLAYNAGGAPETAGLDWRGNPCPAWDALPANVRAKWEAVASLLRLPVLPVDDDADARVERALAAGAPLVLDGAEFRAPHVAATSTVPRSRLTVGPAPGSDGGAHCETVTAAPLAGDAGATGELDIPSYLRKTGEG